MLDEFFLLFLVLSLGSVWCDDMREWLVWRKWIHPLSSSKSNAFSGALHEAPFVLIVEKTICCPSFVMWESPDHNLISQTRLVSVETFTLSLWWVLHVNTIKKSPGRGGRAWWSEILNTKWFHYHNLIITLRLDNVKIILNSKILEAYIGICGWFTHNKCLIVLAWLFWCFTVS